jgi:hypothetical protein
MVYSSLWVAKLISLTSSDSESKSKRPFSISRTYACSPDIILETQIEDDRKLLVYLYQLLSCIHSFLFPNGPDIQKAVVISKHRKYTVINNSLLYGSYIAYVYSFSSK